MPTLKITTTLQFPLAGESTLSSTPSQVFELVYTEKNVDDLSFTGAQTGVDLMGNIADAKACFIQCLTGDGILHVNGATEDVVLHPGQGYFCYCNPDGGLTALTLDTSDDATLRMYMFA